MQTPTAPVVLVTGSSSGIGRALCREFRRRGYRVAATARQATALADLQEPGLSTWSLDVNQPSQGQRTIADIVAAEHRIDLLINNAGYGQFGPMLDLTSEQLQAQFQTNTFAPLWLIQQVAPTMRRQGQGTIVNIGSISGVVTTPLAGAYCASKAALHAFSDALRLELAPFGIAVVTVQPGAIRSGFGAAAAEKIAPPASASWYASMAQQVQERAHLSQQRATPAEVFARQLVDRLERPQPPTVIRLGKQSRFLPLLQRWLPRPWLDWLLSRRFGLARLAALEGDSGN